MKRVTSSIYYPPGPAQRIPLFLFLNFLRNPIEVLIDISKYGDISHFKFGTQHVYFLNHPDYIRDVLVTYNNNFIKSRGLQVAKKVLGDGLLTSEGDHHRNQRQLIQPAFNQDRLRIYAAIMIEYILSMSDGWKDNDVLDVHKEFMRLTLAIVCKALFGFNIIESEASEICKYVTTLVEYFNRARVPLAEVIEKLPLPSNRRFRYAKKQLDTIIYRIINDQSMRIANRANLHTHSRYHDNDLISILLASKKFSSVNGNYIISNSLLRDNVMTISLAGHETVAIYI